MEVYRAAYGSIRYRADIPKLRSRKSKALSSSSCSTLRDLTSLLQSVHSLPRVHSVFKKYLRPLQTQRYVRIYNLSEQKLLKMLTPGIRWISSMDVHPSGDHLIVGGYDRKLCWFDLELSEKPYKILRYVMHVRYISSFFTYTPLDIILVRFGHCIFIPLIRCSRRHPTTGRSRSFMHVCTVTSSQIHLSYRSRFCAGMTYVKG